MATAATLEFGGDITHAMEKWMILEGEEVTFECLARGGKPAAEVLGALGDEQEDVELEVVTEEETEAADGLIDVMKEFRLTPSRADCGKWVKCSASQRDGEGEVVFEAASLAKQVMVARRGGQAGAGGLCVGDGGRWPGGQVARQVQVACV